MEMQFERSAIIESIKHATPKQILLIWAYMHGMGALYFPEEDQHEEE